MPLDARLLAVAFSALMAVVGHRYYKTLLNPVSALCVPLGAALLIEAAFLPRTPFGVRAAAVLVGMQAVFTFGAVAGSKQRFPTAIHVTFKGGPNMERFLLIAATVSSLLVVVGARYVRQIYDSAGVGFVGKGGFDRGLVIASISGTTSDYVVRAVTAFVFPTAVLVALYWLARGRLRIPVALVFATGVVILTLALRARLVAVLALVLVATFLLLAAGKRRIVHRVIPIAIIGPILIFILFSQVASERYGTTASGSNNLDFLYATAGGPTALAVALSGDQPVTLLADPNHHSRGQSAAGLLSLVGRGRALGGFSPVYTGLDNASNINIYTGGWPLIWDLGIPVALVVMLLLGIATRLAYRRLVSRRTPGALLTIANLLFLIFCFPITLISCYNLWWGIWLLVPIINRVFEIHLEMPEAERRVTPNISLSAT